MTERITKASPRFYARIAGFLYLIVIVGDYSPRSSFAVA
jgi:hypothetical protein